MNKYYLKNREYRLKYAREYLVKNRDKINARRRKHLKEKGLTEKGRYYALKYRRHHCLGLKGKFLVGVNKREYPIDSKCEICLKLGKQLGYHHWDDNDLVKGKNIKGIWVCNKCHQFIEFVEDNENWVYYGNKYIEMRKKQNGAC